MPEEVSVYLQDPDVTIMQGDALELLKTLPDGSVHMACTSPPFYGLRDYGTGSWEGGNPDCDHTPPKQPNRTFKSGAGVDGRNCLAWTERDGTTYGQTCGKCGAARVDQQIGLENTPDEWVARLVAVFRELRRVLRDDGSLWLEIGDSYAAGGRGGHGDGLNGPPPQGAGNSYRPAKPPAGMKPKDLIGAPWLLAFALRADGWYLRSEIIWAKPNPMPESCRDRPTVSHSRVFLLTKSARYFYDAEAIREDAKPWNNGKASRPARNRSDDDPEGLSGPRSQAVHQYAEIKGANRRSVWTIPTHPYPEAHFATWPEKLVEPMILAGTSERGVCGVCGAPWERIVEQTPISEPTYVDKGGPLTHGRGGQVQRFGDGVTTRTTGWQPTCMHTTSPVPATILDPFGGAGTTAVVARKLGRKAILLELNADYCALAARRLQQQSLFAV